jgi:hypothetical protein
VVIIQNGFVSHFVRGQPPWPVSGVPDPPDREAAHFGFVPISGKAATVARRSPPPQPFSASILTVRNAEVLYLQPPANKNRKLPFGLASFYRPGDASCQKSPPDASPNLATRTQPNENKQLKTSLL